MYSIFNNLKKKAKHIDAGTTKLETLWSTPHLHIRRYGEPAEEGTNQLATLLESITEIYDETIEDNQLRADYICDVDRFSNECTNIYHDLEQEVSEIEILVSELGLEIPHEEPNGSMESSIVNPEIIENLAISDPYQHLRCEKLANNDENKVPNEQLPKFIATPVIKSIASLMKSELSIRNTDSNTPISTKIYPEQFVYSPYYYK